jgi:peptidoglycan-associated lipoprotein
MTKKWIVAVLAVCLLTVLAVSTGCAKKKKDVAITPGMYDDQAGAGTTEESGSREGLPDVDAAALERMMFDSDSGLRTIYFDYDSYMLRPDARTTLKENAELINRVPGVMVQIEGHCDERGTQEYNLALGEKRALATREYLIQLGVPGDRLITITYGEEDPVDPGHNEAAWAKNRRSEFNRATAR